MSDNDPGVPDPTGAESLAGTVLSGRYRLEEQIGSGGMGTVWRAEDTLLNRPVAVKLLHPAQMAEPTARERFRTEGRITAGLSHPGIAQVYDYGEQDGRAFLIMELVLGEPLSSILRRNSGLEPSVTLDIVGQAAAALAAAHARGVVHRDIKPGNLLVTEDGTVKLTDFGIARGNESVTLTQTGMVMGTAQYISPEQASGRPATFASDLYALGVVAYECLAGQPPFTADTPLALALAHTRDDPPPLPDHVPDPVAGFVAQLLEKVPDERPGSAGEVAAAAQRLRLGMSADQGGVTTAMDLPDPAQTMVAGGAATAPSRFTPVGGYRGTSASDPAGGQSSDKVGRGAPDSRRASLPMVLAAVAATAVLVLGVVWAGRLFGAQDPEANNVRNPDSSPTATPSDDGEPSPQESQTVEEDPGTGGSDWGQDGSTDYGTQPASPSAQPSTPPAENDDSTDVPPDEDDTTPTQDPGGETPPVNPPVPGDNGNGNGNGGDNGGGGDTGED
ncbi:protein kinase [Streptomonospora sp. S1-112]|uniref:non-specific serine/threonine protein kinase n=1 Tax=Streptomonospora mangrovi TaxID=2883123 RepID=A0A9X3SMZ0_9ACTN|nr:serine/threonine-protein kinase [Streptomonospora mangrovi]MDA0564626.1 protein kinase [Streptomonospora mangrovi]